MLRKIIVLISVVFIFLTSAKTSSADYPLWVGLFGFAIMGGFMALKSLWPWYVFALSTIAYVGAAVYFWPETFEGFFYDGNALKPRNVEQARDAATALLIGGYMAIVAFLVKENKLVEE